MATAAGAAALLYYVLIRILSSAKGGEEGGVRIGERSKLGGSGRRRIGRKPSQPPATWFETISTLSETLRFTYAETLGKWPIGDLAFGINYLMRRQGNSQVSSVYAGSNCLQLKGHQIIDDLYNFLRLLTLCMLFSKKPFPVFLESAGFSQEDVLLQKPKAGLLKPAFTILCDKNSKCILLLIRGTHSIKDTLTAATGTVVPFHHSVLHDGGISNLILGYAHCGMVAAARWIAKLSTPCLIQALCEYPDYSIKVVGHSLGGGTAALLTYILREQNGFSSSTCVTFAPAACMTWDLAESGKHFITTIINGSDLVPTFSAASVDGLRSEVTASSWLNDMRDQVEHTRVLNVVYRSATALGSHLPSIASARARVAGAGALLWPVSSSTQVVMKRAQNVAQAVVKTRSSLISWSCMGARRRTVSHMIKSGTGDLPEASLTSESFVDDVMVDPLENKLEHGSSSSASGHDDSDAEELIPDALEITEGELWHELEKELQRQVDEAETPEEVSDAQEITEVNMLAEAVESKKSMSSPDGSESLRFYPPGKIMHIVAIPASVDATASDPDDAMGERVGIYETPRYLYSKLRLTKTMINDHYMPMYKKMIELLIRELESDEGSTLLI